MLSIGIFFAAFVMNPRRSECPAKSPVTPALAARRRSIRATSPGSTRRIVSCPRRSKVRNTGPASPVTSSHCSSAATAQSTKLGDVAGNRGTYSSRVFLRGSFFAPVIHTYSLTFEIRNCSTSSATSHSAETPVHTRATAGCYREAPMVPSALPAKSREAARS